MKNALEATNELQGFLRELKENVYEEKANVFNRGYKKQPIKDIESTLQELYRNQSNRRCRNGAKTDYLEKERGFSCIPIVFFSKRLIQFFIDRGGDVNSQDENGDTALHLALRHGYYWDINGRKSKVFRNVLKCLLKHSADPNIPNLRGETALFTLAKGKSCNDGDCIWEVAKMLLEKGSDIKTRNNEGESLLHLQKYHFRRKDGFLPKDSSYFTRNDFIQRFDDFDLRTSSCLYSQTPLMMAARQNRFECCKLLIERGAEVNATDLQGYTALHHAMFKGDSDECAKLLIDSGANVKSKSKTGKDPYQLAILCRQSNSDQFTYGAEPRKQVEIFEMAGARKIMQYLNKESDKCLRLWEEGMKICRTFNLSPSKDFLTNYNFLVENRDNRNLEHAIYVMAMSTVSRLSNTKELKFWNLLASVTWELDCPPYVFLTLDHLSEELKKVGDFASLEERDFDTLYEFAGFFQEWLEEEDGRKREFIDQISQFHSIVSLAIACFEMRIRETNSIKMDFSIGANMDLMMGRKHECMKVYSTLLSALTMIPTKFENVVPKTQLERNERLIKALINLGLTDSHGNTWLHIEFRSIDFGSIYFENETLDTLDTVLDIKFEGLNVRAKNEAGIEPVQMIHWKNGPDKDQFPKLLIKIADRGAHVDAKNVDPLNGKTLKEILEEGEKYSSFPYDTLQCMCARVLVRSLIPFRNRVPKRMVDFILMHG